MFSIERSFDEKVFSNSFIFVLFIDFIYIILYTFISDG